MKNHYTIFLPTILILAITVLVCSCNNKAVKQSALEFNNVRLSKTEHLFKDTAAPACNLTIDYTYVAKSLQKELSDTLNKYFITACFGEEYAKGQTVEEAINQYAQAYAQTYREDSESTFLQDQKNEEIKDNVARWYSYFENIKSNIQWYEGNLLVYRIDKETYNGGAHGMHLTYFLNIDLAKMRPLRLDDIFKGSHYSELLTDLLWNQLMADNQVSTHEELEEIGYGTTGDLTPTENFYLNKNSITFYYNVYEFTPYVMGPVEIRLPYEMVNHISNLK
ncbi:hypothetical protein EZS27_008105 [termite gut metagenome]|uniref:DUF3298 domain-containing protein n=1 Tax=termite gut metagenome TaxID=433724 RepID=A0A5J4SG71_9ZZZZ